MSESPEKFTGEALAVGDGGKESDERRTLDPSADLTNPVDLAARTEQWYQTYYKIRGADRNDTLHNKGAMLQTIARDISFTQALRAARIGRDAEILDVGCGTGASLLNLLRLGFIRATCTA